MDRRGIEKIFEQHTGHKDIRREIIDVDPRLKVFRVSQGEGLQLGNHYHRQTIERFFVISGGLYFYLEHIETRIAREQKILPNESIIIYPNNAHLCIPDPSTVFLGVLDRDFDLSDIYPYQLRIKR